MGYDYEYWTVYTLRDSVKVCDSTPSYSILTTDTLHDKVFRYHTECYIQKDLSV